MKQQELWQHQARTLGGEALVETIEQMALDLHEIKKNVANLTTSAFPGGDLDGHRRFHEAYIERTAEIRRLRVALTQSTLSSLVWGVIVALIACVGLTLKAWITEK